MVLDESPVLQVTDTHLVFFSSENRYLRIVIAQLILFQQQQLYENVHQRGCSQVTLVHPRWNIFYHLVYLGAF